MSAQRTTPPSARVGACLRGGRLFAGAALALLLALAALPVAAQAPPAAPPDAGGEDVAAPPGAEPTPEVRAMGARARLLAEAGPVSLVGLLPMRCLPDEEDALRVLGGLVAAERAVPPWRRRPSAEPPPPLPDARDVNAGLARPSGPP
ncbi:MAG: hypothetical protein EA398_08525, partial [Deltaproteobacteria bacterium]